VRDLADYSFSPLRNGDLTLYRGSGDGLPPILLVTAENASASSLNRLEHEYTLRADLDASWAAPLTPGDSWASLPSSLEGSVS
jgi:hypothetical protein